MIIYWGKAFDEAKQVWAGAGMTKPAEHYKTA
jgi:hypothetical protein